MEPKEQTETAERVPETTESTPKTTRPRRGRKRSVFEKPPPPPWPVRGLWEAAPAEMKQRAHKTCMLILEYRLGQKSKEEVAKEQGVSPLRVWQQSQRALSGMMAGLLTQPRRKVCPDAFERGMGRSREELKKRIVELEKELSRTEDLVRVLRTAPWMRADSESPKKGGPSHGKKKRKSRAQKSNPARRKAANRNPAPGGGLHEDRA